MGLGHFCRNHRYDVALRGSEGVACSYHCNRPVERRRFAASICGAAVASGEPGFGRQILVAFITALFTLGVVVLGGSWIASLLADRSAAEAVSCSNPNQLVLVAPSEMTVSGDYLTDTNSGGHFTYPPQQAFDGNLSTAWVAPEKDGGVGTTLKVAFPAGQRNVRLVCVVNGFAKNGLAGAFTANGSVGALSVETDTGARTSSLPALDTQNPFRISGVLVSAGETKSMTFRVLGYVPPLHPDSSHGKVSSSITEIQVWVDPK